MHGIPGLTVRLLNSPDHQVMFTDFKNDVTFPAKHKSDLFAVVLNGKVDITVDNVTKTYGKGDTYYIPAGVHSGKAYAGY